MATPRSYRSYAEFEREYIRPNYRVGQTVEDILMDDSFEAEFELDRDLLDEDEDDDEDE